MLSMFTYTPIIWQKGEVITATRLNHIEEGISGLANQTTGTVNVLIKSIVPQQDDEVSIASAIAAPGNYNAIASTKYVQRYCLAQISALNYMSTGTTTKTLTNLSQENGLIKATYSDIAIASTTQLGLVKIGNNIDISQGIISLGVSGAYNASSNPLMTSAAVSDAISTALNNLTVPWKNLASKPTTLSGYGITDAAASNHDHAGVYSPIEHNHDDIYASLDHNHDNAYLSLNGGSLTGALTLAEAPTEDLHAATKAYVDNLVNDLNIDKISNIQLSSGKLDGTSYEQNVGGDQILITMATLSDMIENTSTNNVSSISILGVPFTTTELQALKDLLIKGGD